jgi:hypothetical protein
MGLDHPGGPQRCLTAPPPARLDGVLRRFTCMNRSPRHHHHQPSHLDVKAIDLVFEGFVVVALATFEIIVVEVANPTLFEMAAIPPALVVVTLILGVCIAHARRWFQRRRNKN